MIDTNALLDWLLDRHPQRTKAVEKLLRSKQRLYVPDIVIAETVFTLQKYYKMMRPDIVTALFAVVKERRLLCDRSVILHAADMYVVHPSLSFVDCFLLAQVQLSGAETLWTFDKKLVNQSNCRAKLLK